MYEYYNNVPKTREANEHYRECLYEFAERSPAYAKAMEEVCGEDTLFFLNAFCYVNETRPTEEHGFGKIPMITWPSQNELVETMDKNWGTSDVIVDKARGEGASWLVLLKILHSWMFMPADELFVAGLASKDENSVDDPRDPDSLMWKLDWELSQLPKWLVPNFERTVSDHNLLNADRGHSIKGYSASEDLGTGGRKFVWLWDEFAKFGVGKDKDALMSTEPTTSCRIFVSTHKGTNTEYFRMIRSPGKTPLVVMSWQKNPFRNKYMFRLIDEVPTLEDPDEADETWAEFLRDWPESEKILKDKGFDWPDEKLLSTWYITRCLRIDSDPQSIAQEYDRNPEGTEQQFFSEARVERLRKVYARPPKHRGYLKFDYDDPAGQCRFVEDPEGQVLVWCDLLEGTPLLTGDACIGCDIGSGIGDSKTSNSVAIGFDRQTGEQILEFATNRLLPDKFTSYSLALSYWLHTAQLNWEVNGIGKVFTEGVKLANYPNVYYREVDDRVAKKKTKKPGWGSSRNQKQILLGAAGNGGFRGAVYETACKIRSDALLSECLQFVYDDAGNVVHAGSMNKRDKTNLNEAHGDRVIAAAVAWLAVLDRHKLSPSQLLESRSMQPDTMAYRLREHDLALENAQEEEWAW